MLNFISVVSLTSWSNENSYFWEFISCRINSNNSLKVYSSECLYSPFDTSKFTSERSMPIDFDKNLSKNLKINSIDIPSISFFKFVFYNFVFEQYLKSSIISVLDLIVSSITEFLFNFFPFFTILIYALYDFHVFLDLPLIPFDFWP